MIVSSEGEIEDKESDDLSVVRQKVKIKRQMIVSSEGEIEDKETVDCQ
jgi:hypothetical protein